jgi:hypothetical protein
VLPSLADRLADMETVFGSESILSREHLPMAQASQTMQAYGFAAAPVDQKALVDQKVLVEALSRLLGRTGQRLLQCVAADRRVPVPMLLDCLAAGEAINAFLQEFTSVMQAQVIAFLGEA